MENKYVLKFRKDCKKLFEAKQVGLLYHATGSLGLKGILKSNTMEGYQYRGIAFSSNKMEFFGEFPVELVVDGDKLSENYKVTRLQDYCSEVNVVGKGKKPLYLTGNEEYDNEMYEKMMPKDDPHVIYNIKKYIVGFIIEKEYCYSDMEYEYILATIKKYCPDKKVEILHEDSTTMEQEEEDTSIYNDMYFDFT